MKNTVQEGWESYKKQVMNPEASKEQEQTMEETFYGGALWMFGMMMGIDDDLSTETFVQILRGIKDEFRRFSEKKMPSTEHGKSSDRESMI